MCLDARHHPNAMPTPARLPETTALMDDLRQDGYGDRQHDDFIDSLFEHPESYTIRRLISGFSWENPNGEPIALGEHDRYLHDLPRPQARVIVAIQDIIGKSRLGRGLLKTAREGGVQYGFSAAMGLSNAAQYNVTQRRLLFSSRPDFSLSPDLMIGKTAGTAAHELAHSQQSAVLMRRIADLDTSGDNLLIPLTDRILATRHMEAAANAVSAQIAFDTRQAGDDRIWQALALEQTEREELTAFQRAVETTPASAGDGRARLAAHNAFFQRAPYIAAYDDREIKLYALTLEMLAERQAEGFPDPKDREAAAVIGSRPYQDNELAMMADMPDGINHLKLTDSSAPRANRYTRFTNAKHAGQVAYLSTIAERFRAGAPVTVDMVGDYRSINDTEKAKNLLQAIEEHDKATKPDPGKTGLRRWRDRRGHDPGGSSARPARQP